MEKKIVVAYVSPNGQESEDIEDMLIELEKKISKKKSEKYLNWIKSNLEVTCENIFLYRTVDPVILIKKKLWSVSVMKGDNEEIIDFVDNTISGWFEDVFPKFVEDQEKLVVEILGKWKKTDIKRKVANNIMAQVVEDDKDLSYRFSQVELHTKWKSEYYFEDFLHKYNGGINFSGKDESEAKLPAILKNMKKVIRIVNKGGSRYIVLKSRENFDFTTLEKFKGSYSKENGSYYSYVITTHEGKNIKKYFWLFEDVFRDKDFEVFGMDWVPYSPLEEDPLLIKSLENPSSKALNLFAGFQAKLVIKVDKEKIKPILNHLRTVWFDNDEGLEEWILGYFAKMLQKPRERLPMLSIVGKQGSGKTMLIDFLMNFVIGFDKNCVLLGDLGDIVTRFNALSHHKFLIYIAELEGTENGAGSYRMMNKLKPWITEKKLRAEKKGIDPISMTNYTHMISTSNNRHCLQLQKDDRRHCVIETSDSQVGKFSYFDELWQSISNQDVGNHFYTFLMNYKSDIDIRQIPMTEIRKDIIEESGTPVEKFVRNLKDGIYSVKSKEFTLYQEKYFRIKKSKLYDLYSEWCVRTGQRNLGNSIFGRMLKELGIEGKDFYKERSYLILKENVSKEWIKS